MKSERKVFLAVVCFLLVPGLFLASQAAEVADDFNDLRIVYDKATAYMDEGDLDAALEFFMRAAELQPTFGHAHHGLGIVYYQLGYLDQAIQHFEKAGKLGVVNPKSLYVLAVAYTRTDQLAEAIDAYKKAIELDPEFVYAYHNLGLLYYQSQKFLKAREYLEQALVMEPDNEKMIFALGMIHVNLGNPERAIESITELRRLRDETKAAKLEEAMRPRPDFGDFPDLIDEALIEPDLPSPPARTAHGSQTQSQSFPPPPSPESRGKISITGRMQINMQGGSAEEAEPAE